MQPADALPVRARGMARPRSGRPVARWAFVLASSLAILRYLTLAVHYAVDVPIADDYDAILAFTSECSVEDSLANFLAKLFSFHNEHRMVLPRLVYLTQAFVLGRLDFRVLALLGNLFLVGVFVVLARATPGISPWKKLPIAAVIFQISGWENITWSTVAVQSYLVLLLAFLALVALGREGAKPFALALLAAAGAVLTQANGLLVFPAGALLLARRARWRELAAWLGCGLVVLALFAHGFVRPEGHPPPLDALRAPLASGRFLLLLLGSPFGEERAALVAGSVFVLATIVALARFSRAAPENDLLLALLAFVLGSCVLVVLGRSGFGQQYALSARYRVNVVLAYVLVYLIARPAEHSPLATQAVLVSAACLLALAANVAAEIAYRPSLGAVRGSQLEGIEGWPDGDYRPGYPFPERARELVLRSEELGLYAYPATGTSTRPGR